VTHEIESLLRLKEDANAVVRCFESAPYSLEPLLQAVQSHRHATTTTTRVLLHCALALCFSPYFLLFFCFGPMHAPPPHFKKQFVKKAEREKHVASGRMAA
jgi:hypothetical protein